ncbi:MAG: PD40 domain-containing protein [Anaerolineales bacterium]|nr:PD40 domain-containing protein [Anaerolineales bacterium]
MRRQLRITQYAILFPFLFLLSSCNSSPPLTTSLILYRFDPPAFLEYSADLQLTKEIPFHIPPSCGLFNTFPAPSGQFLLIELNCPNGQTVLFLNTETDSVSQPISSSDAHFLAWTSNGKSAYLKIDSLGSPQIVRVDTDGAQDILSIPEFTYDLSAKPDSKDLIFTLSRGLGAGSELYFTRNDGRTTQLLYSDQFNYISFARFSPDGKQIAFIKTPDTQTPFTVGELWIMDADGVNARKLADADAGHGYAANWSPDGKQIAFVLRENPEDENANRSSDALISNIYIVDVASGKLTQVTHLTEGHAETPYWSPDGNTLVFNIVVNGRILVHIADTNSANLEIKPFGTEATCCPAWMRK